MNRAAGHFSRRLILSLTVVLVVAGVLIGVYTVNVHEREMLNVMVIGADQLSRSITSATWQAMLGNHRPAISEILQTIAAKQGVVEIRIFNKVGRVMYSTRPGDSVTVDKRAEVCAICHDAGTPLVTVATHARARVLENPDGSRRMAIVTPIYNEPACSQAACHAHPTNVNVLGVLDVTLGLEEVDRELAAAKIRVWPIMIGEFIVMVIVVVTFSRRLVDRPIRQLIEGTRAVSALQLEEPVLVDASGEMQELAHSFDIMREHLRKAFAEINQFAAVLEEKVAERTEQLRRTNQKLMQTDRLTSLGQLAASVAHEINNPLSGVLNLSMLMQRIVGENGIPPERVAEVKRYLNQISTETARVGRIVTDLLAFSRRSRPHRTNADLNTIIRSSTNLLAHKIKLANATLTLELQETLPTLMCDPSQMQQVIINLVMNAADAVQARGGGTVTVRTSAATDHVKLDVADTGEGIAEENLSKIFDPFFTTKAEGKGSGLGLAVVYGIVDAHGGVIDVTSSVGVGTTFGITLPLEHDPAEAVLGPVAAAPAPRSDA